MIRAPGGINVDDELPGFKESMAVVDAMADLRIVIRDSKNRPSTGKRGTRPRQFPQKLLKILATIDKLEIDLMDIYTTSTEP